MAMCTQKMYLNLKNTTEVDMKARVKATGEIIDVAPVIRFIDGDAEWYAIKELVILDDQEKIEYATALVEKLKEEK